MLRDQLENVTGEKEVLRQDLYENLHKVSVLEAKLDQYKHGGDGSSSDSSNPTLLEQIQLKLEQEREENEVKVSICRNPLPATMSRWMKEFQISFASTRGCRYCDG